MKKSITIKKNFDFIGGGGNVDVTRYECGGVFYISIQK